MSEDFKRLAPLLVRAHAIAWAVLACLAVSACGAAAQGANKVGSFGNWSLNATAGAAEKICFAATSPSLKEPAGANRAPVVFYVSAWPKDGVKSEISVKLGYKVKTGSDVVLTIDTVTYSLFAKDDRAFIADATQELKLLEAMKKGSKLQIQATSERGTATTDTYSLAGLSQALKALAQSCP